MNFLGNFQVFLFVFFIFCVRRSIDVLDPENQPRSGFIRTGSRALGLTEEVWQQKYENKKEGLQNYLEYSFNSILNIFYRSGYKPWIRNSAKTGSTSLILCSSICLQDKTLTKSECCSSNGPSSKFNRVSELYPWRHFEESCTYKAQV